MRVIHVCAYYAPAYIYGGPVRSIHALCKAQQAHGMHVEVFTTTAAGHARLAAAPDGRDLEGVRVRYFELSSPAMLLGASDLAPALKRALNATDVVHLHGLFNRTVWDAADVLHAGGKPYVLSPRGMLEPPALMHHRWRKRVAWHLKDSTIVSRAQRLHATSSFEADTLARAQEASRVICIPNPVSVGHATGVDGEQWRRASGIPQDAPIVLLLGRLHRIKRLDLAAAAFLQLRQQSPHAHLVIVGPDEHQLRAGLEQQLAPVQNAVHWVGEVDDVAKSEILAAATVLVQCSDSESFGMSVAEALAVGTPVVVTRTCPWHEVEEVGCGLWVDQRASAIADALAAIVSDPVRQREMGRAGRVLIEERMSPASVAQSWAAVYEAAARRSVAAA